MIITLRRQITRHKRAQTDKTLIGSILTRRRVHIDALVAAKERYASWNTFAQGSYT